MTSDTEWRRMEDSPERGYSMHNIDAKVENGLLHITIDLRREEVRKGKVIIASTEGEVEMRDSGLRLQLYLYRLSAARKYLSNTKRDT